jgi:hypothetical protein
MAKNIDLLWELRTVFDTLKDNYTKFYNPSKDLAVEDIIVKFKSKVILTQYVPNKG